ncbi:MAG: heparinase II/III family protein [Acidobacteria bacterium]|nr:heparinase II/III family protein [Acidobacteriota bacterium]
MFRQVILYYHTARYLKPNQILGRLQAKPRARFRRPHAIAPPAGLQGRLNPKVSLLHHDPWNSRELLGNGDFHFLNHQEHLDRPVNWKVPALPLLWQFNLHYFSYLHLLEEDEQLEICDDWIHANPLGSEPAWHPFPTSLRLVNWCKANLRSREISESIYQQAAFLSRNLETHHPGNHLLENARALIFAGSYFAGQGEASLWLERGLEIYGRETPVQVLGDGGHFERSPMYHALMLEGYLDIINILESKHPARPVLTDAATMMCDFLLSVTHPSGRLALFNDSTEEIAPRTRELLEYAQSLLGYQARTGFTFVDSGYFIHETDDLYLIIDGGPIGPSFLPAHAHADIFSFELSLQERPFIVDSGVYEYRQGEMRRYARSTRAHNTVTIDRTDQAECWGSFRVARRFDPKDVSFSRDSHGSRFVGRFDGYGKLIGDRIVHRRSIRCTDARRQIQVEDSITGKGKHLVESMLHLHPAVSAEREGNSIKLRNGQVECLITVERGEVASEAGWYCPRFGVKQMNTVIAIRAETKLPVELSYTITY